MKFFLRDADNILQAECVIIIGTREQTQGLNCGHCGFPPCAGRPEGVPCALNTVAVGIAVGLSLIHIYLRRGIRRICKPAILQGGKERTTHLSGKDSARKHEVPSGNL